MWTRRPASRCTGLGRWEHAATSGKSTSASSARASRWTSPAATTTRRATAWTATTTTPRSPAAGRIGASAATSCTTTSWSNSSPAPNTRTSSASSGSRERFEKLLLILELKMRLLTQRDHPLDYVVLALPTDLYQRCRAVDYVEKGVGHVHRDLRRAFKAMAMQLPEADANPARLDDRPDRQQP